MRRERKKKKDISVQNDKLFIIVSCIARNMLLKGNHHKPYDL